MIKRRQYIFLSFYLTRSLFLGGALSLLIGISKNNLLITSILGMILGYILLYLFYKKGRVNKGCVFGTAFICLFIMAMGSIVLTSNFLLYETPTLFILIAFLMPLIYSSFKEFKDTARISEIFIPVSVVILTFAVIALNYLIKIDNLFPLFNSNIMDFIKAILIFCGASLLPNILLINYKEDIDFKSVGIGYGFGCLVVLVAMFCVLSIYGWEFASIVRFPEYLVLKKIDIFNYVSNLENIFVLEWLSCLIISSLLCVKVLMDNSNKGIFIGAFLLLVVLLYMVLTNNYMIIALIKKYVYYFIFGLLLVSLIFRKGESTS